MLHDSGERKTNKLGSQTDPSHADVAMELLSPYSLRDLAIIYGAGAKKYAPRNWEKGIQFSICVGKLQRHLQQYLMGRTEEDHLNAVGFWWHALAHYREMIKRGLLPASLDDLPKYEQDKQDGTSPGYKSKEDILIDKIFGNAYLPNPMGTLMQYCNYGCGGIRPVEDDKPEEFEEFTIRKAKDPQKGWYAILTCYISEHVVFHTFKFLHKDLKIHRGTGWSNKYGCGKAPGYYKTKAEARDTIKRYKNKPVIKVDYLKINGTNSNWFIIKEEGGHSTYLRSDLKWYNMCTPGGWFLTKEIAEAYVKAYEDKHNVA